MCPNSQQNRKGVQWSTSSTKDYQVSTVTAIFFVSWIERTDAKHVGLCIQTTTFDRILDGTQAHI
jgi:mevalonate pyrophosphate decarboxylase